MFVLPTITIVIVLTDNDAHIYSSDGRSSFDLPYHIFF